MSVSTSPLFLGLLKLRFVMSTGIPARVAVFTHSSGLCFRADFQSVIAIRDEQAEDILRAVREALKEGVTVPCSVDFVRSPLGGKVTARLNPIPEHVR